MARACSVDGCMRPHNARGYCVMHSQRMGKYGSTELPQRAAVTGMPWDEAMLYYADARKMAETWTRKTDEIDMLDDLTNDLMLHLHLKVDPRKRTTGSARNYVIGALWKQSHTLMLSGNRGRWQRYIQPMAMDFDQLIEFRDGERSPRSNRVYTKESDDY